MGEEEESASVGREYSGERRRAEKRASPIDQKESVKKEKREILMADFHSRGIPYSRFILHALPPQGHRGSLRSLGNGVYSTPT